MTVLKGNVIERKEETVKKHEDGLCMTCRHSSSCMYAKTSKNSVLNCEEFENDEASVDTKTAVKESKHDDSSEIYLGLCANCENRKTCSFEKSDAGVWHCEEYR